MLPNTNVFSNLGSDGRVFAYVNGDDLVVRDLVTGPEGSVRSAGDRNAHYEGHAFSRDGRLFYSWHRENQQRCELYLTTFGRDLSPESRLLLESGDWVWMSPYDGSPDGSLVAIGLERADGTGQIGIVSVADGSLRVLKSIAWHVPKSIAFSPDGRYLAFDLAQGESVAADVFTIAVDGSSEKAIVGHPGADELVAWSPDGGHLLFQSDRGGQRGLWSVAVRDGAANGQPHLLRSTIEQSFAPLGFNSQGDLIYGVVAPYQTLSVFRLRASTSLPTRSIRPLKT